VTKDTSTCLVSYPGEAKSAYDQRVYIYMHGNGFKLSLSSLEFYWVEKAKHCLGVIEGLKSDNDY
jgi:hypothetical protein